MATTRKDFGNMTLSDIFKCKKRDGPQGTRCNNCGGDHTVTEEYLRAILEARMHDIENKLAKEKNLGYQNEFIGELHEIRRLLK